MTVAIYDRTEQLVVRIEPWLKRAANASAEAQRITLDGYVRLMLA